MKNDVYKPEEPWYSTYTEPDGRPICVSVSLCGPELLTVRKPCHGKKSWAYIMGGREAVELRGIDPSDESPETWCTAQAAAIDMLTEEFQTEVAKLHTYLDVLQTLQVKNLKEQIDDLLQRLERLQNGQS